MYSFRQGDTGHLMGSKSIEDYLEDIEDEEEMEMFEYDADDMDVSDVEPAYNFQSDGPGDVYPVNEDDMYSYDPEKMYEYDEMESAWADEELEEQPDISGVQGIYGAGFLYLDWAITPVEATIAKPSNQPAYTIFFIHTLIVR